MNKKQSYLLIKRLNNNKTEKLKACLIKCCIFILIDKKTFLALQPHLLLISKLLHITY